MQNYGIDDPPIAGPSRLSDGARDDLTVVFLEFESYPFSDDPTFKVSRPSVLLCKYPQTDISDVLLSQQRDTDPRPDYLPSSTLFVDKDAQQPK